MANEADTATLIEVTRRGETRQCLRVGVLFTATGILGAVGTIPIAIRGPAEFLPASLLEAATALGAGLGFLLPALHAGVPGGARNELGRWRRRAKVYTGADGESLEVVARAQVRGFSLSRRRFVLWMGASAILLVMGFALAAEAAQAPTPASVPSLYLGAVFLGAGFWQSSFTLVYERLRLVKAVGLRAAESAAGKGPA